MLMCNFCTDWIKQFLAFMGGCLGCYSKPTPVTAVDEPTKRLQTQGQKRASASEDFWSTSTHDLEYTALQSHRSISSISTSNQALNPNGATDGTSTHTDFVNHGLIQWNQTRLQWATSKNTDHRSRTRKFNLSWNLNYETLLGTSRRFSHSVPLSEMVDFLVDNWEHEGLYD